MSLFTITPQENIFFIENIFTCQKHALRNSKKSFVHVGKHTLEEKLRKSEKPQIFIFRLDVMKSISNSTNF